MLTPGTVIADKYALRDRIGRGAMGEVWHAVQVNLDRAVAIKFMHAQYAVNEDARSRFAREARVAASLEHPSSVSVLDFGESDGQLYLVMELLVGESLRDRLDRDRVPLPEAVRYMRQVGAALAAAHRIRLVHRDLKPGNVFLESTPDGPLAKVVDFGLAFIADPDPGSQSALGRLTREDLVAGTPAYMSPEQVRGSALGPASDVYALGCILYELVAGHPPFVGTAGEVMTRHAYAPAIPLRSLDLEVLPPPVLDDLVQAMLAKAPPRRPSPNRIIAVLAGLEVAEPDAALGRPGPAAGTRSERSIKRTTSPPPLGETLTTGEMVREPTVDVLTCLEPLDDEILLSLTAAGIATERPGQQIAPGALVWAPGASIERLTELARAGALVIAAIGPADAAQIPALIRAGVADVVVGKVDADGLVRRIRRTLRHAPEVA